MAATLGNGNITFGDSTVQSTAALPLTGGTLTGDLVMSGVSPTIRFTDTDASAYDYWAHVNSNQFYILVDRGGDGTWETPHPLQLDAANNIAYTFGNTILHSANFTSFTPKIGNTGSSVDLNTVTVSGMYRVEATLTNKPSGAQDYAQMLVIHGANDTIAQMYFDYSNPYVYVRSGNPPNVGGSGAWTSWVRLDAFPAGTKLMFAQSAAPTGWTQITDDTASNRMLRVVTTAGAGTGGSHSPILNNVVPSHTHGFTSGNQSANHSHSFTTGDISANHYHWFANNSSWSSQDVNVYYEYANSGGGWARGIAYNASNAPSGRLTEHTHYVSGNTGWVSSGHTHSGTTNGQSVDHTHSGTTDNGSSQTNWTPRYIDMILCSKN